MYEELFGCVKVFKLFQCKSNRHCLFVCVLGCRSGCVHKSCSRGLQDSELQSCGWVRVGCVKGDCVRDGQVRCGQTELAKKL